MPKLTIMRGLQASGKSTHATKMLREDGNLIRISRDCLRPMLFGKKFKWTGKKEKTVIELEIEFARVALGSGKNVIIDDTNLPETTINIWKNLAKETDSKFNIIDLTTTVPVETCYERNLDRFGTSEYVPHNSVVQTAYKHGLDKTPVTIIDIDGTIADETHRNHLAVNKDWDTYFSLIPQDKPLYENWSKVTLSCSKTNSRKIFLTGRPERTRKDTEDWLNLHYRLGHEEELIVIMRPDNNRKPAHEFKRSVMEKVFKPHNTPVKMVFEDNQQNVDMFLSLGYPVTQF